MCLGTLAKTFDRVQRIGSNAGPRLGAICFDSDKLPQKRHTYGLYALPRLRQRSNA